MTTWTSNIEDENGDLVDINYYCSQACALDYDDDVARPLVVRVETDYSVLCLECGKLLWDGLEDDGLELSEGMVEIADGIYSLWSPPREQLGMVLNFAVAS